jgi:hypothetical protein
VRELIESIALEGTALTVHAREPLPVDRLTLAAATALRVFERYPVLTRVTLAVGDGGEAVALGREEVVGALGVEGLGALRAWGGWRQALARVVQAVQEARRP